jgi:hypothetical protein
MFGMSVVAAEMGSVFNSYVLTYVDVGKYVGDRKLC